MTPPSVSILIVSFGLDQPWLHQCLRAIDRYAVGFQGVHVVYPSRDHELMLPSIRHFQATAHPYEEPLPPLGHLSQNAAKCHADEFVGLGYHAPELRESPRYVTHLDSDTILTGALHPDMLFRDGLPVMLRRRWADADAAQVWRDPTDRALGFATEWETMAGVPLTYDATTYWGLRDHMKRVHRRSLTEYALAQKPTWPSGFCEFNALGNFAAKSHPWLYHWLTLPAEPRPSYPIRQLWSHCGVTDDYQRWIDETLEHGERRPPPAAGPMRAESRRLLGL